MSMSRAAAARAACRRMMALLEARTRRAPPFAPPFLKAGKLVIGQTANILLYLGERHGLAPANEAGRLWANQLQLTIADLVDETHDTHHPIAERPLLRGPEAARRSAAPANFLEARAPKYLGYFERVLERNPRGDRHLVGARLSYADLSLFQLVAGLRYAFPQAMKRLERRHPRGRGAARPRRGAPAHRGLSRLATAASPSTSKASSATIPELDAD